MSAPVFLLIDDSSRIAECRRVASLMAEREGVPPASASNAAIVATELASNLWKHGRHGEIHITALSSRGETGIEILSIDRGPGMSDVAECLADGHSTAGTAGTGLGAVRRLSDHFDICSQPCKGTVLVSQIRANMSAVPGSRFTLGVTSRPVSGEALSGDAWAMRPSGNAVLILVADGLGHGLLAYDASAAAVNLFLRSTERSPTILVQAIHRGLHGTRGAAVAVASIQPDLAQVKFCGLGNIAGFVLSPPKRQAMVSHNGTAGHEARHIREFVYPWTEGSILVMHSDGLSADWDLAPYPGLLFRHPSLIAAVLFREAARERDDACVVVGKLT